MNHTRLSYLSNEELLRVAQAERESLTTTDLEVEALQRFETLLDEQATWSAFSEVLAGCGVDDPADLREQLALLAEFEQLDIRAVLEAITAAGIDDAKQLTHQIAAAVRLADIAEGAAPLLAQLNALIKTTIKE